MSSVQRIQQVYCMFYANLNMKHSSFSKQIGLLCFFFSFAVSFLSQYIPLQKHNGILSGTPYISAQFMGFLITSLMYFLIAGFITVIQSTNIYLSVILNAEKKLLRTGKELQLLSVLMYTHWMLHKLNGK